MNSSVEKTDKTQQYRHHYNRDVFPDPNLCSALEAGLRRVRSWPSPPNWSGRDWHEEMQEVGLIAAVQAASEFEPGRPFPVEVFIYHRVLARALTCYRREWAYSSRFQVPTATAAEDSSGGLEEIASTLDSGPGPADFLDVHAALGALHERHRRVIIQVFWEGYTEAEIAVKLGISQRAVSKRKQAGLKQLRKVLPANEDSNLSALSCKGRL